MSLFTWGTDARKNWVLSGPAMDDLPQAASDLVIELGPTKSAELVKELLAYLQDVHPETARTLRQS